MNTVKLSLLLLSALNVYGGLFAAGYPLYVATFTITSNVITVTPAGGMPPYRYALNGTPQLSNTFPVPSSTFVPYFTSTVTVTDSAGATTTIGFFNGTPNTITSVVTTPDSRFGASDGAITITATIGEHGAPTPPGQTFFLDEPPFPSNNSGIFTNLSPNTYHIDLFNGSPIVADAVITTVVQPALFAVTVSSTASTCGLSNGTVTLTRNSGGVGPTFTYALPTSGQPPVTTTASSVTFTGLASNTPVGYPYTVTDNGNGQVLGGNIVVGSSNVLSITTTVTNIDIVNDIPGSITATIVGMPPFTVTLTPYLPRCKAAAQLKAKK